MKCIREIHHVPGQPGRERMDLHCIKPIKGKDYEGRGCELICHMGVITEDPKEWVCHDYNFEFRHEGKRFYLRGYDYLVDSIHQTFHRPYEKATILSISGGDQIMKVEFIPISTGDNMHEEAWKLFHRLRNLVIFS
jgi:hypothetical protein